MQQHMTALRRANEVRLARAEIRRKINVGELTAIDVLDEVPAEVAKVLIGDFLTWLPGIGRHRALKILSDHDHRPIVGAGVPLGSLSLTTRRRLAASIDDAPVRSRAVAA